MPTIFEEFFNDQSGSGGTNNNGFSITGDQFFSNAGNDYMGLTDGTNGTNGGGFDDDFGGDGFPNVSTSTVSGNSGNYLIAREVDGNDRAGSTTLVWTVDISGFDNLSFTGLFAGTSVETTEDSLILTYSIDGGSTVTLFDFDGGSDGTNTLTTAMQSLSASIAGTGSTLTLRLTLENDDSSDLYAVDSFVISGDVSDGALTVTVDDSTLTEFGPTQTTGTVTRVGTSGDEVITITSSDTSEVSVPTTVTILDGQTSADFIVSAVDDGVLDGSQTATITASGTGFTDGSTSVTVLDDEPGEKRAVLTEPFNDDSQFSGGEVFFADAGGSHDDDEDDDDSSADEFRYTGIFDGVDDNAGTSDFGSDSEADYNPRSYSGTVGSYLVGEFTTFDGTEPTVLTWSDLDISGLENLSFSGFFGNSQNGHEAGDFFFITASIDDGPAQTLLSFIGNGNLQQDTDLNGSPDGTFLSSTLQEFTSSIAGTGSSLDLTLTFRSGNQQEDFVFDEFAISGDTPAPNTPTLGIDLPDSVDEGGSAVGQVTLSGPVDGDVVIVLSDDDGDDTEVSIPSTVTIESGETSADFTITGLDDNLDDGDITVVVTATGGGQTVNDTISISDQDTASVSGVSFDDNPIDEGTTTTGTVSLAAASTTDVVVTLVSSDTTEVTVPGSVTIAAGDTSATFTVTGVED
ncbi:MAG: hypothetical protein AAGK00_07370, partial [Pseudomonadota bacterium]